jgi:hypothetical protein
VKELAHNRSPDRLFEVAITEAYKWRVASEFELNPLDDRSVRR